MGLRSVRIYTIHPPAFYTELARYNRAHPDAPLYLVQGVYLPDETYNERERGLYDKRVDGAFASEIEDAVKAVHGELERTPARGRAEGRWRADVSAWIAGWIIGVEWDPHGVELTDRSNRSAPQVRGRYFRSTAAATPTERWLARHLDRLAELELAHGVSMPLAFTNWPTTDPLSHPTEPLPQEDLVGVDANHVAPTKAWPGGTFASYHAYPYYPDFQRHEPGLTSYELDGNVDPYAGYLAALRDHHGKTPVLVTEFGVPSSIGYAHEGPLDRDQGGHTEQEAMAIDAELLRVIHRQGLSGAFLFSWIDEWFKFTWNTFRRHAPVAERLQLWYDPWTNEQWFGLKAADAGPPEPPGRVVQESGTRSGRSASRPTRRGSTSASTSRTHRPAPCDLGSTSSRAAQPPSRAPRRPTGRATTRSCSTPKPARGRPTSGRSSTRCRSTSRPCPRGFSRPRTAGTGCSSRRTAS